MRRIGAKDELCRWTWPARRPARQPGDGGARVPCGKCPGQEHQAPAPLDEFRELLVLSSTQRLVADGDDDPPLTETQGSRVVDHLNIEVMRQLQRMEQCSRVMPVVGGMPRDESLDSDPVR